MSEGGPLELETGYKAILAQVKDRLIKQRIVEDVSGATKKINDSSGDERLRTILFGRKLGDRTTFLVEPPVIRSEHLVTEEELTQLKNQRDKIRDYVVRNGVDVSSDFNESTGTIMKYQIPGGGATLYADMDQEPIDLLSIHQTMEDHAFSVHFGSEDQYEIYIEFNDIRKRYDTELRPLVGMTNEEYLFASSLLNEGIVNKLPGFSEPS